MITPGDFAVAQAVAQVPKLSPLSQGKRGTPLIACLGDSTFAFGIATTAVPTSLVNNGDGTATATFASLSGVAVGDMIGVQNTAHLEYRNILGTAVTATGVNSLTYSLNGNVPTVSPDGGANTIIMLRNRVSVGAPISYLRGLCGRQITFVNVGSAGDTSLALLNRFDTDVAPFRPDRVLVSIGINDTYGNSWTLAQSQTNIIALLAKCQAIGASMDILTPFPQNSSRGNWSTGNRDIYTSLRKWLIRFAVQNSLFCCDWAGCSAGTTSVQDPTSASANPISTMIQSDHIHETLAGSYLAAKALASFYNLTYGLSLTALLAKNVTDGGLITNPLFAGTGGTKTNGTGTVAGTVADNVTVTVASGTGVATCSITARTTAADGDVAGNWQTVSFVAAAAGDICQIKLQNLATGSLVTNGDNVRIMGQVQLVSGNGFCKELSFLINSQTATTGNLLVTDLTASSSQQAVHPEPFNTVLGADVPVRTPVGTHGAVSNFIPVIQFTASAAGTIVVQVACWSAEKIGTNG